MNFDSFRSVVLQIVKLTRTKQDERKHKLNAINAQCTLKCFY